ncbi:MAG: N-acetyltransferase [Clostridiales bacterium]|jgi:predicted N-acetyltransferase YhbS|nr:N-acetyltransferase [Clostridiales bacterium]
MEYGLTYRLEEPKDYASVESLTREAFWNVYKPGCDEHFIVHSMRGNIAVIDELNYVCEDAFGFICGHIFYTHAKVMADDGQVFPVISFGPISVHPDYQKKGIGSTLIQMTMKKAKEMKCSGIIITGNPEYYHRFGFRDASDFNIVFEDGSSFPAFLACELEPNALGQVHGRIQFCPEFSSIEQDALLRFDQQFPKKERLKLPSQLH